MPQKLTYEYVKKEFEKRDLLLLDDNYINSSIKLSFMNKDGYISTMRFGNLMSGKTPCYFSKFNPYTIYNIQLFLDKKNSGTKILTKNFIGNTQPLRFLCKCNKIFIRTWADLSQKNIVCPDCVKKIVSEKRKLGLEYVKNKFSSFGFKLLSEEYINNNASYEFEDKEGYRGFVSIAKLSNRGVVRKFDKKHNLKNYLYNANLFASKHNYNCEVIGFADEEKWTRAGIKCKCFCGNIFQTSINSFTSGKFRCEICAKSISSYEKIIKNWLESNDIKYEYQKKFPECKDKIILPFDFYIKNKNLIIEIDGQGHYYPANFNQCSFQQAEESFYLTQKHDKIKNVFCKENNINLIRIPYWEMDNNKYLEILTNIFEV